MISCLKTWTNNTVIVSIAVDEFHQDLEQLKFLAYGVIGGTIVVFGIVGNALSLIVLSRPCLQGVTFRYLSWLAISDMFTLVAGITSLLRLLDVQPKTYIAAVYYSHVELPVVNSFMASSVFLVVSVTVDRYFSVCHPTRFRDVHNKEWANKAIFLSYFLAFVIYIPVGFEKHVVMNNSIGVDYFACENTILVSNVLYKIYIMFKEVVVRLGPVVILLVLNTSIIISLYRRRNHSTCRSNSFRKNVKDERRLTVLLATIVLMFFVCMTPAAVLTILHTEDKDLVYGFQEFRAIANVLELSNYSVNFYIYCMCSSEIRMALMKLLCPCSRETVQ